MNGATSYRRRSLLDFDFDGFVAIGFHIVPYRRSPIDLVIMAFTALEELEIELVNDTKVKVAGIDADGVIRGKIMSKEKFLSAAKSGFGFCRYPVGFCGTN
jgi:hypothetical protein